MEFLKRWLLVLCGEMHFCTIGYKELIEDGKLISSPFSKHLAGGFSFGFGQMNMCGSFPPHNATANARAKSPQSLALNYMYTYKTNCEIMMAHDTSLLLQSVC